MNEINSLFEFGEWVRKRPGKYAIITDHLRPTVDHFWSLYLNVQVNMAKGFVRLYNSEINVFTSGSHRMPGLMSGLEFNGALVMIGAKTNYDHVDILKTRIRGVEGDPQNYLFFI